MKPEEQRILRLGIVGISVGAAFDLKRFHGGFKTVLGPEAEHAGFMFGFIAEHVPTYGIVSESGKASDAVRIIVNLHCFP